MNNLALDSAFVIKQSTSIGCNIINDNFIFANSHITQQHGKIDIAKCDVCLIKKAYTPFKQTCYFSINEIYNIVIIAPKDNDYKNDDITQNKLPIGRRRIKCISI